ncbi:MAG: hypothetical protein QOH54_2119 [Mycobacterium sp.]|nr:hypothetical protein [Mycobacterium sp.]
MTLIQTYFTQDRVIQVSDRRLTRADGTKFDDNHTKLVFWHGCFTVGFTGLAFINPAQTKSTSEWIAETLCDYTNFERGVVGLCAEAEKRIRLLSNRWDKRLCIVVAGFDFRRNPLAAQIANYGPPNTDLNTFAWRTGGRAPGRADGYLTVGAAMEPWQHRVLGRSLRRVIRQPDGINHAIRLMVGLQRKVAQTDPTVGAGALCATIPRERSTPFGPGSMMSNLGAAEVGEKGCQFVYFAEDGFNHQVFGPHSADHGAALGGWFMKADPSNLNNQSVSVQMLKWPSPK